MVNPAWCQQAKEDESPAGKPEIPQLSGGRHAHLEQEEAERALEGHDKEAVGVVSDLVSL